jgi:hypothetical protein
MCEPPAIKRIDFYCHSDLSLAGFIVAAAPHAQKKCQVWRQQQLQSVVVSSNSHTVCMFTLCW